MSRRSLATPLIVAVLATVATGVTFSTAGSSPVPTSGSARTGFDVPVGGGLLVGQGLSDRAAHELSEAFPGWKVDVDADRRASRGASPVVVIALRADARRWRSYLVRHATDVLPARTTVVFQSLDGDRSVEQARRTATLLSRDGDASSRRRR